MGSGSQTLTPVRVRVTIRVTIRDGVRVEGLRHRVTNIWAVVVRHARDRVRVRDGGHREDHSAHFTVELGSAVRGSVSVHVYGARVWCMCMCMCVCV